MICKECGHLLNEGNKFCPNCGAKVVARGPVPNMGASKSKLDDLMSNLNQTTEPQKASENWTTEAPKHKRDFQFEEINWNLDGYPTEGKKETEEIDFNWEAVVEPIKPEETISEAELSEALEEGGSYLGKVNEELRDPAKEDRDIFRAMEKDAPGFEECVANKLDSQEEKQGTPDFMKGQNYAVAGEETGRLISREEMKPEEPVKGDGSYLGDINEEFKNPSKDDRNAFIAMEKEAPGFEECVANKLEAQEENPKVPDFMKGQNYDVVGENSELTASLEKEALEISAPSVFGDERSETPDGETGNKIDKFYTPSKKNAEFQAILDKEYNRLTKETKESAVKNESYLGEVNEEFKDPSRDDRDTFRAMEKETPGFEECVAGKLETPKDDLFVPEFVAGQNYAVAGEEPGKLISRKEMKPEEPLKGDGSYLGEVNEEFKDPSRDDRDTFREMEKEAPGFEECVASKLEAQEENPKVPEFMAGQNYDVVGEASEPIVEANPNPEKVVEGYIEDLNAGEVSLVDLLKAAAKKEQKEEGAEAAAEPAESYLGEINEEFNNPAKADRDTFREMEKETPGFEECVANKLETPEDKPVVPDFVSGQNYDVVGEPAEEFSKPEESQFVEPVEFMGVAQPQEQAPVFATAPEEIPAFTSVVSETAKAPKEELIFADNLEADKGKDFDYTAAAGGFAEEREEPKTENSQIIEDMIKEDMGQEQVHPDDRITFQDVFKEEIMAEREEPKKVEPKKHTLLKVLFIILAILILLEVIVIGIKTLAPTSGAAVMLQDVFNTIFSKFTSILG